MSESIHCPCGAVYIADIQIAAQPGMIAGEVHLQCSYCGRTMLTVANAQHVDIQPPSTPDAPKPA